MLGVEFLIISTKIRFEQKPHNRIRKQKRIIRKWSLKQISTTIRLY